MSAFDPKRTLSATEGSLIIPTPKIMLFCAPGQGTGLARHLEKACFMISGDAGMGNGGVIARSFDFVAAKLVIFESAKGPIPNLADWIAGERINGSWWSHPFSEEIFLATRAIRDQHEEALVCRLVIGKITYVHRNLWAALYRLRHKIEAEPMAQILETHDEREIQVGCEHGSCGPTNALAREITKC